MASATKSISLDKPNRTVQVTAGAKKPAAQRTASPSSSPESSGIPSAEVSALLRACVGASPSRHPPLPLGIFSVPGFGHGERSTTQLLQNHVRARTVALGCQEKQSPEALPGSFRAPASVAASSTWPSAKMAATPATTAPRTVMRSSTNGLPEHLGPVRPVTVAAGIRRCHRDRFRSLLRLVGLRVVQCAGWAFSGADKLPLVYNNASSSDKNLQCKATVANHWKVRHLRLPF